jgi:alkanesulfonate monooxygenase SsuD/methylene tetrahydromethanopterin reductase-like flavin-dependent oxidoreductase (luciferase family)
MAPPSDIPMMRDRIFQAARAAGRDPDAIIFVYNMNFRVDEGAAQGPEVVTGSPQTIADQLKGFTELGFTAMNFSPVGPEPERQVERLAQEVLPRLRGAL